MKIVNRRFIEWQKIARRYLSEGRAPSPFLWLTNALALKTEEEVSRATNYTVPSRFLKLAKVCCAARDERTWGILYSVLWRITHGERHILDNPLDNEVLDLLRSEKAIRRDIHKMHAFVRFKESVDCGSTIYCAWHKPDHHILRLAIPFFLRRFGSMRWTIMTPDESVAWSGEQLVFFDGVKVDPKQLDAVEEQWKTYYASTFNPARVKVNAMVREMPRRHWKTLPEAQLIPELLRQANARVASMQRGEKAASSAIHFSSLAELAQGASCCQACPLYARATQTVFGVGPKTAQIVVVGEQPGDEEDKAGSPFIGPAGKIFDSALREVGIKREDIYITNAVKHFKWEERGKRRLHKRPSGDEILACKPWLISEIAQIRPKVILCLGATAAHSLLGRTVNVKDVGSAEWEYESFARLIVSYHPSAVLRAPDDQIKEAILERIVRDLDRARSLVETGEVMVH